MQNFNTDQLENINATLETLKGLLYAANDITEQAYNLVSGHLATDSDILAPQLGRLGDELLALSNSSITITEQVQGQLNSVTRELLEGAN